MYNPNIVKCFAFALSIAATFSSSTSFAEIHASSALIKVQPATVYHAIRGKPLVDTLTQVAQRSGITFKIHTNLSKDIVSQTISADNWNNAVRSLLSNYNFTTIQDGGMIKTVIITGRTHDAADTATTNITAASTYDIIVIEPLRKALPAIYQDFPAGSVTAIDLPVNALMNVKGGSSITLDLPIGQYNVVHDHTVNEDDGSKTWVGYLSDEGEGYRVFLSQGASGTMGIVTTPDGTYNIESSHGVNYLVDTNKLRHAGYEGDEVMPPETMMGGIAMGARAQASYDQTQKALGTPPTANKASTSTGTTKTVVDLMVVYTTASQTADYAKQRITLLVTASNQAYIDSGINMKLRLVYTEPTAYVENNGNSQALIDLASGRAAFAGISQKRLQYGADLVFLFRPLYAQTAGSCGTTYVQFAYGNPANKWTGYGTIGDGSSKDALKGYYCAINTFTHEIGHSLGLVHDREYSSFPGVFDYSYAWGVQGTFATIMSYKQPVLMYFSTPLLATKCAGQPCGYPATDKFRGSDQAKSVNYTAPFIANFMASKVTTPILK